MCFRFYKRKLNKNHHHPQHQQHPSHHQPNKQSSFHQKRLQFVPDEASRWGRRRGRRAICLISIVAVNSILFSLLLRLNIIIIFVHSPMSPLMRTHRAHPVIENRTIFHLCKDHHWHHPPAARQLITCKEALPIVPLMVLAVKKRLIYNCRTKIL